jgi:hypothetical protein
VLLPSPPFPLLCQVAVKLLAVDAEDPCVLDAFLKEVALCACLRGSSRVVRLLGACLGGGASAAQQQQQQQQGPPTQQLSSASASCHTKEAQTCDAAHATPFAAAAHCSTDSQGSCEGAEVSEVSGEATAAGVTCSSSSHSQQQQQQLALIMELVEGGNLSQRIYHASKRRLSYLEVGGCCAACCCGCPAMGCALVAKHVMQVHAYIGVALA